MQKEVEPTSGRRSVEENTLRANCCSKKKHALRVSRDEIMMQISELLVAVEELV